jgi:transcriptional regulator with XRE-family HTH domain
MGRADRLLEAINKSDKEAMRNGFISGREQRGLSQDEMAEKAGYSLTQYMKLENGERIPTIDDFIRIGGALLDYDDSLKPVYQRKLQYINHEINIKLEDLEHTLEIAIPGMDKVFNQMTLRKMLTRFLIVSVLYLYISWSGLDAVENGLAMAIRWLSDILPEFKVI